MSFNQNVRGQPTTEKPTGLYDDIINVGRILVNNTPPISTSGVEGDFFIDSSSDDLYGKKSGGKWGPPIYNFGGGGGGGTLTNLSNIGTGDPVFKGLNGTVAELRSISSDGNGIIIATDIPSVDSLNFSMNPNYKPESLSRLENWPLLCGLGSGTFSPDGLLPLTDEYNRGSLFIQTASPNRIWLCNDPVTKSWSRYVDETGVFFLDSVGSGAQVLKGLVNGVGSFKSIRGEASEIAVIQDSDQITLRMLDDYVPVSLNRVTNIKDNRDAPISNPTASNDSTQNYKKGSLWIEQEIAPGSDKIWICNDATAGAAVWKEYKPSSIESTKDYVQYVRTDSGYTQNVVGGWQDFNTGGTDGAIVASRTPTGFTFVNDGTRGVFRRASVTSPKAYECSYTVIVQDFAGPTTTEHKYLWRLKRKSDGFSFTQGLNNFVLPVSTANNRFTQVTASFIFDEPNLTTQDYYLELDGSVGSQSFNIEYWGVSFKQI